jgi:hypothetical protein
LALTQPGKTAARNEKATLPLRVLGLPTNLSVLPAGAPVVGAFLAGARLLGGMASASRVVRPEVLLTE